MLMGNPQGDEGSRKVLQVVYNARRWKPLGALRRITAGRWCEMKDAPRGSRWRAPSLWIVVGGITL